MPSWVLGLFIFAVWFLWALTGAVGVAARDARRGIPEGQWGGFSAAPVIPIFPAVFWGMAWLIDRAFRPWGTAVIGAAHAVYAVCLVVSLFRDLRYLRSRERSAQ
jgi:hypothetical protein